ncbi:hypothetical protein BH11MYX1_BH11MYX1_03560 [soil metagenome]
MARIPWLGPVIAVLGVGVAGLGAWYAVHARPEPGEVIDTIAIDPDTKFVLSDEKGNRDRSFIELDHKGEQVWQALIPHYAGEKGRPAVAWNDVAVTVRVERNGRAEVFALSMHDATKLGGFWLAPEHEHEPIAVQPGPITLTDHIRSYELVGGEDWHQLVAVDLRTGKALWKVDLGHWKIEDAGVQTPYVWVVQGTRKDKRWYNVLNGVENKSLN